MEGNEEELGLLAEFGSDPDVGAVLKSLQRQQVALPLPRVRRC